VKPKPPATERDIAVGLAARSARAAAAVGRIALLPARIVARAPGARRAADGLAAEGRETRLQARQQLGAVPAELVTTPELERAIDDVLEGPLTDAVARSLAEHRVVERVAGQVLASADFEAAFAAALEHEATQRLVERALASPGVERLAIEALESKLSTELTDRVVRSPEFRRAVEQIASSPEVRSALTKQTTSFAGEVASGLSSGAERLDDAVERPFRRMLRRPPRTGGVAGANAGIVSRGVALVLDVVLAHVVLLLGTAAVNLLSSLVGELRPEWLVATLVGAAWALTVGTYFVLFWTVAGQTPGMRLMSLRVDRAGSPPSFWRSLVRLVGLALAIVPLFAGFLPVLFDERRRALQDYLAGTVVVYRR
jgi:uncharacterized RDD family membrane protein YckC